MHLLYCTCNVPCFEKEFTEKLHFPLGHLENTTMALIYFLCGNGLYRCIVTLQNKTPLKHSDYI